LTGEDFRREIAGLSDGKEEIVISRKTIHICADFLSLLPKVYGSDLERKKMWTRISNGIVSSLAKCGGSVERFCNEILEYIHANPAFLTKDFFLLDDIDEEEEILSCFQHRNLLIVPLAREKWDAEKARSKKNER